MTFLNSLKVFQFQYVAIPILFILLVGSSILTIIPNSYGQEDTQIPSWIKKVAEWWAHDEISEREFLSGIEYMINNNIISLFYIPCSVYDASTNESVPDWIKNNAKWWSEDLIDDIDFINAMQYLVKEQIIAIDNKEIVGYVPIEDLTFSPAWIVDKNYLVYVQSHFFEIYGQYGECTDSDGWKHLFLGLNPTKMAQYNEVAIWNDPQNVAVVYPYFTSVAYNVGGFYDYYAGICDTCTTTKFKPAEPLMTSSGVGHQTLTLLGYQSISDIDVDKNPDILQQFDKVIMLHNEYVTRAMFDAITNHPNVLYLYPNALYAEIEVDYTNETITLIRGHNYPEQEIENGFDWEFDNTHPYEYDTNCLEMEFYKIENGWMTNCYPESVFLNAPQGLMDLLKIIKSL